MLQIQSIGFLSSECALVVELTAENGFKLPKSGNTRVNGVVQHIRRLSVKFPVCFLFDEETKGSRWKGYIIPPLRKVNSKKPKKLIPYSELQSTLNAYKWLIENVCSNIGTKWNVFNGYDNNPTA